MKGKDFVIKKAQEAVNSYYQLNSVVQNEADKWFIGTCSPDFSSITDDTGKTYELIFTGSPQLRSRAFKISPTVAFVTGQPLPGIFVSQQPAKGYIISMDGVYPYIRTAGSDIKYYLPICSALVDSDFTKFRTLLSSDGKAALLGTIEQNTNFIAPGSFYHQIVKYGIFKNIQLLDYTSTATENVNLSGVQFSVPIDQGFHIAFSAAQDTISNFFNLNDMSDGQVPAPEPATYPARSMFFPHSNSRSGFFSFGVPTVLAWDQDTGMQYYKTDFIPGASVAYNTQKLTQGNNTITWSKTLNSTLFNNYVFTLNNDLKGNYNADLVVTSVNCYLFGLTDYTWQTSFACNQRLDYDIQFVGPATVVLNDDYHEDRSQTYSYAYDSNFAYTLQYFSGPDIWLPIGVVATQLTDSWIKNVHHFESSNVGTPSTFEGSAVYNAISNTYVSTTSPSYFDACQFAFRSSFTVGPPWINGTQEFYDVLDFTQANFYTGLQRTYKDFFNTPTSNFPGYYIHSSGPSYDYMDLNYDNVFPTAAATSYAVFAGRNSMVVNNLAGTPILNGIVTQILGDGADFNLPASAFRGRGFTDNLNTAFVYRQDYNQIYRYSSPWLFQGNLSNIAGTGQAQITDTSNQDAYTDAQAQLVNWQALADVYDDTALSNQIGDLMLVYRSEAIPPTEAIDSVIANIIALNSDFTADASRLKSQLYAINGALGGDTTLLGIDVIGYNQPDVYTDKIFSASATWPFPQPGGGLLKALDSYIVCGYYIDESGNEVIQNYNISDGSDGTTAGLTSLGKKVSKPLIATDPVLDYVLPVKPSSTIG